MRLEYSERQSRHWILPVPNWDKPEQGALSN